MMIKYRLNNGGSSQGSGPVIVVRPDLGTVKQLLLQDKNSEHEFIVM